MYWKELLIGLRAIEFAVGGYAITRQHKLLSNENTHIDRVFASETLERKQKYGLKQLSIDLDSKLYYTTVMMAILILDLIPTAYDWFCVGLESYIPQLENARTDLFMGCWYLFEFLLMLPVLVTRLNLAKDHGLFKRSVFAYASLAGLLWVLLTMTGMNMYRATVELYSGFGKVFFFYTWLYIVFLDVVAKGISLFIMPLWMRYLKYYRPLEDGPLRDGIFKLANDAGIPLSQVYMVNSSCSDSSTFTSIHGFWNNKQMVVNQKVTDGLATFEAIQKDDECTLSLIAHDMGCYKSNTNLLSFGFNRCSLLSAMVLLSQVIANGDFYYSFGFESNAPMSAGVILFVMMCFPLYRLYAIARNYIAQSRELEADKFVEKLGFRQAYISALTERYSSVHFAVNVDKLYSIYYQQLPPLQHRLDKLGADPEKYV